MGKISLERLRELVAYDPDTGIFTWRITRSSIVRRGEVAGAILPHGYRRIMIDYDYYYASRLAWFYVHGEWPKKNIDHVNGITSDDRIANLREASQADNCANMIGRSKSGIKGVRKISENYYRVEIVRHGKRYDLGVFKTLEEAAAARKYAALKLQGNFAFEARQ